MKRNITLNSYLKFRRISFSVIALLGFTIAGLAQPMFFNNTYVGGANAIPFTPNSSTTFQRAQFVWGPGTFTGAYGGTISKVYFYAAAASNPSTYNNFVMKLGTSSTNPLNSGTWHTTGMQTVINSSTFSVVTAVSTWAGFQLTTPFAYDPTKFLIIDISSTGTSTGGFSINQQTLTMVPGRVYGTATATNPSGGDNLTPDFGFDLLKGSNDAGISFITTPLCKPAMVATYNNSGINTIDSVRIGWSVNGTLQNVKSYTTPLASTKNVAFNLSPDYSFADGSTYTVKAWTFNPNNKKDTLPQNDTFRLTFKYLGPSQDPQVSDVIKCGPGRVPLKATPGNAADSILWYNAAVGGSIIAKGKNTLSPPLVLGVNTYYVMAQKLGSPLSLANSMVPSVGYGSTYSGGFANITPSKGVIIDSIAINLTSNIQNATFNVYYKSGTYIGSETNRTLWTQVVFNQSARVRLVGSYYRAYIKLPEVLLSSGITYGFYATTTPTITSSPWTLGSIVGGVTVSNADLTVFEDRISYGASEFATPQANYPLTWETHYRPANCPSNRVPIKVTVKPSPNGAAFIKGSVFQTTMPNTNGYKANPDIVANGDKLSYEITPPTGYNNADYGVTWIMSGFTLKTSSGRVLSTSYYSPSNPAPSGANNAKFTFTPDSKIIDSTIIMTVSLQDLGPHFCDSLLTRYIFIAPRPVADFKFSQPVCDGDKVLFNNLSSITSGGIGYHWDFGTGNPADTANTGDVAFTYPTYGTYTVKVTTISLPYGYTDSKTQTVDVSEIPKIGFKVFNACLGDSVSFVNASTISKGTIAYKWDMGNGSTSNKVNPKMKYPVAGSYRVTLTATSNGCSQVLTKNAWEFARPVAKFATPKTLCDKTDIPFTNGSTITMGNMGYRWYFGDGGTSTATNPTHSYTTSGTKNVKMKVTSEFGCADSITKDITLNEAPLANFTYGPVCNLSNTKFTFTGTKPGGTVLTVFNWDFGGEGSTSIENPSKQLKVIGKKFVTLTVTSDNGCSDVTSKEVEVKLQSKADFDASDVCDGENAIFVNKSTVSSGNLNYFWKFGDGNSSSSQAPRHLYPTGSQTYNVTLVAVVPGGCSDSVTKAVSINATPSSDFTYQTSGRLVNYKATQPGNTKYHWDFGDGASAETVNTQYHYLNSFEYGKFTACLLVVNAAGCYSQSCKEVVITGGISTLNKLTGVKIYPNPNKGNFTVTVEEPKSDIAISIYNILGDMVKTIETNAMKSVYQIDLDLANGVYLVKVTNGGMVSTQKVTVNK